MCRWPETLTFGAGYICDAFWFREACRRRDPPFTAERPFFTEADVEMNMVLPHCDGQEAHVGIPRRANTHPTQHVFTSVRFQAVGVPFFFQVCMNTQRTTALFALH